MGLSMGPQASAFGNFCHNVHQFRVLVDNEVRHFTGDY